MSEKLAHTLTIYITRPGAERATSHSIDSEVGPVTFAERLVDDVDSDGLVRCGALVINMRNVVAVSVTD